MEDKALEILRVMLGRRKLDTKTEAVTADDLERANLYLVGKILVVFSQKDKVLDRDFTVFLKFAEANGYKNGMIIVAMSPPSENVERVAKLHSKDRVQFFHIRELQFDITTHRLVCPHRILNEEERTAMFEQFKIMKPQDQIPYIDSQDAMVKWIGAIPGDVVEITRHSDVAGPRLYYRYCVEDVNVA